MAGAARREQLRQLEAELPPDDRALLHLRHDRELSWDEIAEILSAGDGPPVTAPALRKRYERLKERLGRMAKEAGLLG
jgi:RNA polymerase sigma-70 factor (ECF subfamily)